jgi:DNA-binding NarL/FixJ family response regulator
MSDSMNRQSARSKTGDPEGTTRSAPAAPARAKSGRPTAGNTAPPDRIRVLCVDDHPIIGDGLAAQFAIEGSIWIVGRLGTAERLLPEVVRLQPHVVLLDIEMPGPDAFEAANRLRHVHPGVPVIVLSAHIRDGYISAAFKAGACGYFSKSDDLADLVAGIREVAASPGGSFVLGPKVRERCRPLYAHPATRPGLPGARGGPSGPTSKRLATSLESLTAREAEVLRLIGKGLSRVQIAAQLSRSVKTIDGHQDHLMKKLGLTSRADLIRFAIREGLAQA